MANRVKALLDELAGVLAEMGALNESEEAPSEEETKSLEALDARAETLRSQIELVERIEKREAELRSVLETAAPVEAVAEEPVTTSPKENAVAKREFAIPKHYRALRCFENEETAYRAGMWLKGFCFGDREAQRWCNDYGVGKRADAAWPDPNVPANSGRVDGDGMFNGVDPVNGLGGATVADEFSSTLYKNVLEYGAFPSNAQSVTMNSDVLVQPKQSKGLEVSIVGENYHAPVDNVEYTNVNVISQLFSVMSRIPNSLLADSVINLAENAADEMARAYAKKYDELGFNAAAGEGEGGISGINSILTDGSHSASVVQGSSTLAGMELGMFSEAIAKLPAFARSNAKWYMSPAAFGLACTPISMLIGGNTRSDVAAGPVSNQFLGYPVELVNVMYADPGASASTDVFCLFGDLSLAAIFGNRRTMQIKTSTDLYMQYDQTALVSFSRAGILVHETGTDTECGPVIAIVGGGTDANRDAMGGVYAPAASGGGGG